MAYVIEIVAEMLERNNGREVVRWLSIPPASRIIGPTYQLVVQSAHKTTSEAVCLGCC